MNTRFSSGFFLGLSLLTVGAVATAQAQSAVRPGSAARTTTSATGNRSTTSGGTRTGTSSGGTTGGTHQYRSNTELGDATIQIDSETRSLVIVTDEDTHRELEKVIKALDRPKPQVLIKVVFLEVTYNKDFDVGLEASYTFNVKNPMAAITGTKTTNTTNTSNGGATTTTSNLTTPLGSPASLGKSVNLQSLYGLAAMTQGNFARVVSDDWTATLYALAQKGKVELLSRPSIMARNNQEAVIVVGQEVPFVTNSRITDDGQTINTIQYDNVGIILRVTPFITSEQTVEMIVAPEISALTDQTVAISNNASAPVISKRSAETVVVTPHGETVVIGGLMQTQRTETIKKVPILGDIPVIGFPFRHTVKSDVKSELLIFLTPYIVNDKRELSEATANEMNRTELIDRSFQENELTKYLDTLPEKAKPEPAETPVKKATEVKKAKVKSTSGAPKPKAP